MYRVDFLHIADQDISEIFGSIKDMNEARVLLKKISKEIEKLMRDPYANRVYISLDSLSNEYRKISIEDYVFIYFVDAKDGVVYIARVIHRKIDYWSV